MLQATWDWYYGSAEEEVLNDCQFGEPYSDTSANNSSEVVVRPGTYENGDSVNIFTVDSKENSETAYLESCSKHLKVLRHPNILRFIGWIPLETECHLLTEHAYPLSTLLNIIDAHEICSGLHDIALALQFIHDKAGVTHNHVCIESIFVHDNGPWKLGRFDYACQFEEATESFLKENPNYVQPPEEKGPHKIQLPVEDKHGHSRDVYMFGVLLDYFFEKIQFSSTMQKSALRDVVDDIMRDDHENRPTVKEILNMSIFKSAYISIIHFLQSITLRSKLEKEDFFKSFLSRLKSNHIFPEVIGRRIIPLLLTPIALAEQDAINHVINYILTPASEQSVDDDSDGGVLPESVFARYVIPKIVELFKSRLIHVRIALLENFSNFVHLFEESVLKDVVLPEIIFGLSDASNQIVQYSLHALADAVAVVGADTIVGSEREKVFTPGIPKFDGRVLNESSTLAYEEKIPPRKKFERKLPSPEPRKPTLLELAMMKNKSKVSVAPTVEILLKQKKMAHLITQKSKVHSNGVANSSKQNKPSRSSVVHQIVQQPDVETWASSEEDESDMDWPDINDVAPDDEVAFENSSRSVSVDSRTPLDTERIDFARDLPRSAGNSPLTVSPERFTKKLGDEFEIKASPARSVTDRKEDFFSEMLPGDREPSTLSAKQALTNGETKSKDNLTSYDSTFSALAIDDEENGWSDDSWN